jgi:hypothetical protein
MESDDGLQRSLSRLPYRGFSAGRRFKQHNALEGEERPADGKSAIRLVGKPALHFDFAGK